VREESAHSKLDEGRATTHGIEEDGNAEDRDGDTEQDGALQRFVGRIELRDRLKQLAPERFDVPRNFVRCLAEHFAVAAATAHIQWYSCTRLRGVRAVVHGLIHNERCPLLVGAY